MHVWIIDGHNVIFAIPRLKHLQTSGNRAAAREELQEHLRRFAVRSGIRAVIVFDGNDAAHHPAIVQEPLFETIYARLSDGEADDRIIHEARAYRERGHSVTVVTDDVRTLAIELPPGVRRLDVQEFWRKRIEAPGRTREKWIVGDFSDVEQAMEAREAAAREALAARREREIAILAAPREREPATGATGSSRAPVAGSLPATELEMARERLRRKKEKGRLHQERRLKARRT